MIAPDRPALILASTSRYRRELLTRLRLPFTCEAPGVEETAHPGETPGAQASRLARDKAIAVALRSPDAVVIGSDQVADLDGVGLGKPGTPERATDQLRACRGREVTFHTAVCVVQRAAAREVAFSDQTRVRFRQLDDEEIARYLAAEQPWDCAGSFKSEGLGACLFDAIRNDDPTALVGLPLIALARTLRGFGYALP
jgi:septum formation protein